MECDYLYGWIKKRSHTQKSHSKVGEPQRYSWGTHKKEKKNNNNNNNNDNNKIVVVVAEIVVVVTTTNLIYIAQFNTNSILKALCIVYS